MSGQNSSQPSSILGSVPQSFFELLARLVPGMTGVIAYLLLSDSNWSSELDSILGTKSVDGSFSTSSTAAFLIVSYVLGQIVSPLAKLMQRVSEAEFFGEKTRSPKRAYDWLRFEHPRVGALCAKIRAEFTMHNGLSVVLFVSAFAAAYQDRHCSEVAGFVLVASLCAWRGRTTRDTFNGTVCKMALVADFPEKFLKKKEVDWWRKYKEEEL